MPADSPSHGPGMHFDATGDGVGSERGGLGQPTVRDLLFDAQQRLTRAGVPSPKADAATLMSWVFDVPRTRLMLLDAPTSDQRLAFEKALAQRLSRVPLQHITGSAPFRRIELSVGPGVFVPRPETEVVCEAAMRYARSVERPVVVDLCSGSGAIGLSMAIEIPGSNVHLVELDGTAVEWLQRNVDSHRRAIEDAGSKVKVICADARTVADPGGALASLVGAVDVVVSNPPYIPDSMVPREVEVRDYDPALALFGGPSGLDVIAMVNRTAALLLRPGGGYVVEHADVQGADADDGGVVGLIRTLSLDDDLSTMLPGRPGAAIFEQIQDRRDLTGLPRFAMAVRSSL